MEKQDPLFINKWKVMIMPKTVAVANQKGGVGKTTTAINLSSCVAYRGKKVLLVDLDPQGNTTTGMGINKRDLEMSTYDVIINEASPKDVIIPFTGKCKIGRR